MKYKVNLDGRVYEVEVETADAMSLSEYNAFTPATPVVAPIQSTAAPEEATPAVSVAIPTVVGSGEAIDAPMPGTIVKICVTSGQAVKKGDILVILEAMKMENEITAPKDGTITQILAQKGSNVNTGTPLVVIG